MIMKKVLLRRAAYSSALVEVPDDWGTGDTEEAAQAGDFDQDLDGEDVEWEAEDMKDDSE